MPVWVLRNTFNDALGFIDTRTQGLGVSVVQGGLKHRPPLLSRGGCGSDLGVPGTRMSHRLILRVEPQEASAGCGKSQPFLGRQALFKGPGSVVPGLSRVGTLTWSVE